ncbi:hypothetical protein EV182_003833 [Spiromyces aspiralis]|uniref:Uncharacterized protein n=1 Tax=Spiromyces aspiralis TaxID=68401 RepID=A0ACC1HQI5_9FUNG|nr:hypothetical protein EV182_003833 [Spiromyces aspiralis]
MALASTRLPAARLDEATGLVTADYGRLAPLRLGPRLFPLSFVGVDAHVLADPSDAEESLCDSRLLVVVDDQGGLVNVWKRGGGSAFSRAQIRRCVEMTEAHRASLEAVWPASSSTL